MLVQSSVMFFDEGAGADVDRRPLLPNHGHLLTLVTCQIGFAGDPEREAGAHAAAKWKRSLGRLELFKKSALGTVGMQRIQIGASGIESGETQAGWQVRTPTFTAALYPGSLVVEDRQYTTFDRFIAVLKPIVDALGEVTTPEIFLTFALRYQNVFQSAEARTPAFWRSRIRPAYMAGTGSGLFLPRLQGCLSIMTLSHDNQAVQIRAGIQPAPNSLWQALIDYETTETTGTEFSWDEISEVAQRTNTTCLRVFQELLEPEYLSELHG